MVWISAIRADAGDIGKALHELEHDSDRAAGIVGAVFVEESLTALIQSRLQPDKDLIPELFRSSGPLGAFSVKINVGYLMNLYSGDARKELETIKEIRNEFAHRIARSFSFERIRDLSNNLSISERAELHITVQPPEGAAPGTAVVWIGGKPEPDYAIPTTPVLPPIAPEKLVPRERYSRACQFYAAAFAMMAQLPRPAAAVFF